MLIPNRPSRGRHCRQSSALFTVARTRRRAATGLLAVGLGAMFWAGVDGIAFPSAAQAATVSVNQCNGIATTPGLQVQCTADVVNNLNLATGARSSTVTLTVCQGAANATPTCATPTIRSYTGLTNSVTQCNGSVLGGGGVIICAVHVANRITGRATTTTATVNQCNGSGQGGGVAVVCNPTASTTGATITQCNGSGNGGAGVSVTCTVAPSTRTSALPVTVNQCVGSGNGGGSVVTCTVSLTNRIVPAAATTAPASKASGGSGKGRSGGSGSGNGGTGGSDGGTSVISAPVLAPSLSSSPSFTAPAGLTGDTAAPAGHSDLALWGLALGSLVAGLLVIVVRPSR